jgi:hypothetical protein
MRKFLRVVASLAIVAILFAVSGFAYLYLRKPSQAPPPVIRVAMTPERIARGEYIFRAVADCDGCHSQHDYSLVGGPVVPSGRARGNLLSDLMKGLPGVVVAPNLTPDRETGIGAWTDGEKMRAIREGVDRDGNALFPMMPYQVYRHMSDEDVESVVAFLDSLPPIHNPLPKTKLQFVPAMMIKSVPSPAGHVASPDRNDRMKYGEYLATVGGCEDCHTPSDDHGQPIAGMGFAGGQRFETTIGTVVSANITPDLDTGIGKWSEEFFLKKFQDYKPYAENGSPKLPGPEAFSLMPWLSFSAKSDEEHSAIFAYLKSRKPVRNSVETHPGFPRKTQ